MASFWFRAEPMKLLGSRPSSIERPVARPSLLKEWSRHSSCHARWLSAYWETLPFWEACYALSPRNSAKRRTSAHFAFATSTSSSVNFPRTSLLRLHSDFLLPDWHMASRAILTLLSSLLTFVRSPNNQQG